MTKPMDVDPKEEAVKHVRLAVKLVGHAAARRIVEELATEARLQRQYLMSTGGWS